VLAGAENFSGDRSKPWWCVDHHYLAPLLRHAQQVVKDIGLAYQLLINSVVGFVRD
jgi:hypothetical protein